MSAPLSATVVVAAHNRPERLARLLAGLAKQDRGGFDVVVVDDGSQPPLSLAGVPTDLAVRLIRRPNGGPGPARHTGIAAASGDIIVLVDDDMIVPSQFVSSHVRRHAAGADVAIGRFSILGDSPLLDFQMGGLQRYFEACELDESNIVPERLCTGNVSFRRMLYDSVGGFDLSLRRCEDKDLGIRFGVAGAQFGFARDADTLHDDVPLTPQRWLQVGYEFGRADVAIGHKYPRIAAASPWKIFADTVVPARALIWLLMLVPPTMRPVGNTFQRLGKIATRLRLRAIAVPLYALAYSVTYFAGVVDAHGGASAAQAAFRSWKATNPSLTPSDDRTAHGSDRSASTSSRRTMPAGEPTSPNR